MKTKILIILAIIVLLAGLFYWFGLRKPIALRDCYFIAQDEAREKAGREDGKYKGSDYDFYFKICLNKKGIK